MILSQRRRNRFGKRQRKEKRTGSKSEGKKLSSFEVEFANIEFEGREVPAQELADKLDTSSRTLLSWLGDSNKRKKDSAIIMKNIRELITKCISEERKNRVRQTRKTAQSSAVMRRCAKRCAGPILRIVV